MSLQMDMSTRLDDQFARVLGAASGDDRVTPAELLRLMQWKDHDARSWDEAISLAPSRELPRMIAADLRLSSNDSRVERFQRAHIAGLVYGIVADRRADQQALRPESLEALERRLRTHWVHELSEALCDARRANEWALSALVRFRSAVRTEARAFSRRSLAMDVYCRLALDKLSWALLPSLGLVYLTAGPQRMWAARGAMNALLLTLQFYDDGIDADDDARVRGASYPELLGLPPTAFFHAAHQTALKGAAVAAKAQLGTLQRWLSERAEELARNSLSAGAWEDRLKGFALAVVAEGSFEARDAQGVKT